MDKNIVPNISKTVNLCLLWLWESLKINNSNEIFRIIGKMGDLKKNKPTFQNWNFEGKKTQSHEKKHTSRFLFIFRNFISHSDPSSLSAANKRLKNAVNSAEYDLMNQVRWHEMVCDAISHMENSMPSLKSTYMKMRDTWIKIQSFIFNVESEFHPVFISFAPISSKKYTMSQNNTFYVSFNELPASSVKTNLK